MAASFVDDGDPVSVPGSGDESPSDPVHEASKIAAVTTIPKTVGRALMDASFLRQIVL